MFYYIGYDNVLKRWRTVGRYISRESAKEVLEHSSWSTLEEIKEVSEEVYNNINFIGFEIARRRNQENK